MSHITYFIAFSRKRVNMFSDSGHGFLEKKDRHAPQRENPPLRGTRRQAFKWEFTILE